MSDIKEQYQLPSQGIFYDGRIPDGIVEIRPLLTKDEAYLAGGSNAEDKINNLVNRCVTLTDGFDPMDLLSADRAAILFQIRRLSYGDDYSFSFVCPTCRAQGKYNIKMSELKVSSPPDGSTGPWKVKLPKCGKTVEFKLLTGKEDERLSKMARQLRSKMPVPTDVSIIPRLAAQIVSVEGESTAGVSVSDTQAKHDRLLRFIESLVVSDTRALRKAIAAREPGIDLTVDLTCSSCGFISEGVLLPMSADFFRSAD